MGPGEVTMVSLQWLSQPICSDLEVSFELFPSLTLGVLGNEGRTLKIGAVQKQVLSGLELCCTHWIFKCISAVLFSSMEFLFVSLPSDFSATGVVFGLLLPCLGFSVCSFQLISVAAAMSCGGRQKVAVVSKVSKSLQSDSSNFVPVSFVNDPHAQ